MPRPQGPAWKYYDVQSRDKHGNKKVKCKSCLKEFTASHTRLVGHFDPDDKTIETCQAATAECLDEMSKYVLELKTKAEAAARIRCVVEYVLCLRMCLKLPRLLAGISKLKPRLSARSRSSSVCTTCATGTRARRSTTNVSPLPCHLMCPNALDADTADAAGRTSRTSARSKCILVHLVNVDERVCIRDVQMSSMSC